MGKIVLERLESDLEATVVRTDDVLNLKLIHSDVLVVAHLRDGLCVELGRNLRKVL